MAEEENLEQKMDSISMELFFGDQPTKKNSKKREMRAEAIRKSIIHEGEIVKGFLVHGVDRGYLTRSDPKNNDVPHFKIWNATNIETDEDVVLKAANPALLLDLPALERYILNESILISRLSHPNIIRAAPTFRKRKMTYLPLEFMPYNIAEVIGPRPTTEGIAFFAMEAAMAVEYLESQQVVHGDIKPQQFMAGHDPVDPRYSVIKLLDFSAAIHPFIVPVGIIYSKQYLAPEASAVIERKNTTEDERKSAFTHRSDMFALGLSIARVALTAEMDPDEISEIYSSGRTAELATQALYDNHLPYMLNRVIEAMTAKDPNERPSGKKAVNMLDDFMDTFGLGPKMILSRELYSGKLREKGIERPY